MTARKIMIIGHSTRGTRIHRLLEVLQRQSCEISVIERPTPSGERMFELRNTHLADTPATVLKERTGARRAQRNGKPWERK